MYKRQLREAMFYDGVSVEIRSAADDNRKQAEDVHYFIDKGVDLLIISANEAAPMTPIVEEAYQKGIPVILVDRKILSDKYTAYIGADNYEIGRAVGNYIASSLKGKGNVVELTGLGGSTPAMERHQGFMAAISNYPDIKPVSYTHLDVYKRQMICSALRRRILFVFHSSTWEWSVLWRPN